MGRPQLSPKLAIRRVYKAIYALPPIVFLVLFSLGSTLALAVYLPIPTHFCAAASRQESADTGAGCSALSALSDWLAESSGAKNSSANSSSASAASHYLSGLNGGVASPPKSMGSPSELGGAIRVFLDGLFVFSIVFPRLFGPEKLLSSRPSGVHPERRG